MSRRIELNRHIAGVLSPVLIPEIVTIVQSYTPLPDAVFVIDPMYGPLVTVERLTFRAAATAVVDDNAAPVPMDELVKSTELVPAMRFSDGLYGVYAIAANDRVYCGGESPGFALAWVDPFASDERGWTQLALKPAQTVRRGAFACVGSILYLFGGGDYQQQHESANVWKFDTGTAAPKGSENASASNGWKLLPAKLTSQKGGCHASLTPNERTVYITGSLRGRAEPIDVFDVESETCKSNLALPNDALYDSAMCYYRDAVWLIGGAEMLHERQDVCRLPIAAASSADSKAEEWVVEAPLQIERGRCRAVVVDDTMFAIGGRGRRDMHLNTGLASIEAYDVNARRWVVQTITLKSGRESFAIAHCY